MQNKKLTRIIDSDLIKLNEKNKDIIILHYWSLKYPEHWLSIRNKKKIDVGVARSIRAQPIGLIPSLNFLITSHSGVVTGIWRLGSPNTVGGSLTCLDASQNFLEL